MDMVAAAASWLHVVAAVVVLGYYVALGLFLVPALRATAAGPLVGESLAAIERRALPWLIVGAAVFVATGGLLMLASSRYTGLGTFFGTTWASLIVVKHLVVGAMIVMAGVIDLILVPDAVESDSETARSLAVQRARAMSIGIALLGAVVILLTAAARAS